MSVKIQRMFDSIAGKYDFLNHFLSMGRDIRWRKKAVALIPEKPSLKVLDLCGGTGDFLREIQKNHKLDPSSAVGDFSYGMLAECQKKFPGFNVLQLDAMGTPLPADRYDIIVNGFGMRNLDQTSTGIREAHRLLSSGGNFITLEFFQPTRPFNSFFYKILAPAFIPILGAVFSKQRDAYEYLVNSIRGFLTVEQYAALCRKEGFLVKNILACDGGIAYIVQVEKL